MNRSILIDHGIAIGRERLPQRPSSGRACGFARSKPAVATARALPFRFAVPSRRESDGEASSLPLPFGPTRPTRMPEVTVNSRSLTIVRSPKPKVTRSKCTSRLVALSGRREVDIGGGGAAARVHVFQLADQLMRIVDARLGLRGPRFRTPPQPRDLTTHAIL